MENDAHSRLATDRQRDRELAKINQGILFTRSQDASGKSNGENMDGSFIIGLLSEKGYQRGAGKKGKDCTVYLQFRMNGVS